MIEIILTSIITLYEILISLILWPIVLVFGIILYILFGFKDVLKNVKNRKNIR